MVRRVVPDDNSCLFTAVGYLVERRLDAAAELRVVVADTVLAGGEEHSAAVLGTWGGALPQGSQLSMLHKAVDWALCV